VSELPLGDLRVVELGQLLAGPFCGQLLGDFGAEVIKVEDPGRGDPMREWGREKPHGKSLWWPVVARNKLSVTCNLRAPEGQDLLRRLLGTADVLVENFRPGTLVALHHRERSGRGQVVDSAIYEAVLGMMESLIPEWAVAGYQRERTGAVLPNVAPSNVYPTGDGDLVLIAANQDTVFGRLAGAMGQPGLAADPRFATHGARGAAMTELDNLIAEWTGTLAADDLLARLHEAGVPAGRIFRARDMLADPHFAAREAIVKVPHPDFGPLPMQNVVPKLSVTPGAVRSAGPALGEHNEHVWGGLLGLGPDERARLHAARVI